LAKTIEALVRMSDTAITRDVAIRLEANVLPNTFVPELSGGPAEDAKKPQRCFLKPAPTQVRRESSTAERTAILRRLLLAVGLCVGLSGPAFAYSSTTTAWSNMRHAPNGHSRVVQSVPASAEIDLQSCAGNWCYASWRNLYGYIPSFAVAEASAPPGVVAAPPLIAAAPPVVVAPSVVVGPAFGWGGPYVGIGYGWGWRRW
jgi:hypothetical protein